MRAIVVPVAVSAAVHALAVLVAAHAPAQRAARHAPTKVTMRHVEPQPKPPLPPPPPPRRIARATPKRVAPPIAPPPSAPPPPPQGFSVDTKSTVASSSVAVAAKEGGGNLFADPNRALPPGDKSTAPAPPPPAPEPLEPAQWLTDEADRSPPYPGAALRNEIEGQVLLRVCVGPSGSVDSVQLVKGLGFGCDEAAANWAKSRWRFRPARRGATAVPTCLLQPMRFQLQR